MILSDKTIRRMLDAGELVIKPLEDFQIQSASVDVRIGRSYATMMQTPYNPCKRRFVRVGEPIEYVEHNDVSHVYLYPQEFILATTMEYIELPTNVTSFVEGRSSIGRMGLFVQNAGWVDPGFKGEITLELFNASNTVICLEAGCRIGQLVFCLMDSPASEPYKGKYMNQRGATGSRIHMDEERAGEDKEEV